MLQPVNRHEHEEIYRANHFKDENAQRMIGSFIIAPLNDALKDIPAAHNREFLRVRRIEYLRGLKLKVSD